MNENRLFGTKLKTIREQRKLTQQELAELIDRSVEAVSNLERGISLPSLITLTRLAAALDTTITDLISPFDSGRKVDMNRLKVETIIIDIVQQLDNRSLVIAESQLKALLLK